MTDIFLFPLWLFRRLRKSKPIRNIAKRSAIVVFESHLLGDYVMTLSLLNALRLEFPESFLIYCANKLPGKLIPKGIVDLFMDFKVPWSTYDYSSANLKAMLKILRSIRKHRPRIAVETRGDPRNGLFLFLTGADYRIGIDACFGTALLTHRISLEDTWEPLYMTRKRILEEFGIKRTLEMPELPRLSSHEENQLLQFLRKNMCIKSRYVVIHPGASQLERAIPPSTARFIIELIREHGIVPILVFGPADERLLNRYKEYFTDFPPVFQGTIPQFISLCHGAVGTVSADSGPAHLAAWACVNSLVLCFHDRPQTVRPLGRGASIVKMTDDLMVVKSWLVRICMQD